MSVESLVYSKDHMWADVEGDKAKLGITDYAQGELGDIVFIEIETLGEHLEQEEVFGTVEAVKTVSDLFMPVSGDVIEINNKLEDKPDLVNKDPYGEGWLIKVKVDDINQVNNLLDAESYKKMIEV